MRKFAPLWVLLGLTWCLFFSGDAPASRKDAYRFHYRGTLSYAEGDLKQANQYFRRAYHILPGNFYFAISYGLTQGQRGDLSEALDIIRTARRRVSFDDPEVKRKKSLAQFFMGLAQSYNLEFGQAYRSVSNGLYLLEDDPEAASVFENTLGYLRVRNQAVNSHQRENLPAHYHVHQRDLQQAIEHFERALELDPGNPAARYNYKMLCDTLGYTPRYAVSALSPQADEEEDSYQPTFLDMHTRLANELELSTFDELVFLVDISGSMVQEKVICMGDTRFNVMKELARRTLATFSNQQRYGLGTIGGTCDSEPDFWKPVGSISREELDTRFRFLIPDGTTPLLTRMLDSPELFSDSSSTNKTIFLISDGANTCRVGGVDICQFAEELAARGITVNVLTFLSTTLNNTNAFAEYLCLAETTDGHIIYMDNYQCKLEPLSFDLLASCQLRLPVMEKSTCWGEHIDVLWNIFPEGNGKQ